MHDSLNTKQLKLSKQHNTHTHKQSQSQDKMESPMPLGEEELTSRLNEILQRIALVNDGTEEEEIRVLKEHIRFEVTTNPVLLRCTSTNIYGAGSTLLSFICDINNPFDDDSFIKFLIESDPSALLLPDNGSRVINMISSSSLCVLMPWIAAKYPWVLHHGPGIQSVFDLIERFASREDNPECTSALIKQFFEAYPQALVQEDDDENTPLHKILRGGQCCDADLFKWMAQQCPNNMSKTNNGGMAPLHIACLRLGIRKEDSMSMICKYLITYCPDSVQSANGKGRFPIHLLLMLDSSHQNQLVREVIVCLLWEYPESYGMPSSLDRRAPNSYPFIRYIKPLLNEEKELMENANQLRELSPGSEEIPGTLSTAVECTSNELVRSTANVFNSWAISFVRVLESKVEGIATQLDHACIDFDDNDTAALE